VLPKQPRLAGHSVGGLVPIGDPKAHPHLAESAVSHFQVEEGRLSYRPGELWPS
jgi:hypothetical protein